VAEGTTLDNEVYMDEIVDMLGIFSFIGIGAAFGTGFWMKHNRPLLFKVHRKVSYAACAIAVVHGILALLS
jgi:hypothetical protein